MAGEATIVLAEALDAAERVGAAIHRLRAAGLLALARRYVDDFKGSDEAARIALQLMDAVSAPPGMAYLQGVDGVVGLAEVLAEKNPERAERLVRPIVASARHAGWREHEALALLAIGVCRRALQDDDAATEAWRAALRVARAELPGCAWRAHARLAGIRGHHHEREAGRIVDGLRARVRDVSIQTGLDAALNRELDGRV